MKKILLALVVLGTGVGAFHAAHSSTAHFQHEAKAVHEALIIETQRVATAQSQQVSLKGQVEDLKRNLRQRTVVAENPVWSALQTNPIGNLSLEMSERLREELGFTWLYSPDYIVVSKETVHRLGMPTINESGRLSDLATTVLAVTPQECSQLDAALQQIPARFSDWTLANIERIEPQGDEVAHYRLPPVAALALSASNALAAAFEKAVGRERAEMIMLRGGNDRILQITGVRPEFANRDPSRFESPEELIVKRFVDVNGEARLGVQVGKPGRLPPADLSQLPAVYPAAFRAVFPNGWADLAEREGFELPKGPPKE